MVDDALPKVSAADVRAFLGLPEPLPMEGTRGYRESAFAGLDGEWVGAFAQAFLGPAVVSSWRAAFDGESGHSTDRHGRARLALVTVDGAYVEFTKTYEHSRQAFRYRGKLEGSGLVGYWEAPGLRGLFALTRVASDVREAPRVSLRRGMGGWLWVPGLVAGVLAEVLVPGNVPQGVAATVVLLVYAVAVILPLVYAHLGLIRRLADSLAALRQPPPMVRVEAAAEAPRVDGPDVEPEALESDEPSNEPESSSEERGVGGSK